MTATSRTKRRVRVAPNLYQRPTDGKFEAGLSINGRWTMKTLSARTKREAKLELARLKLDAATPTGPPAAEPEPVITVAAVAEAWLSSFELLVSAGERKPRTLDYYRSNWRNHVEPLLASREITCVSPDDIVTLLNTLRANGKSPHVLRAVTDVVSRIFKFAVRRGYIDSCPVSKLERGERPKPPKRKQRILSLDELRTLLDAADGEARDLIALHVYTGMRQGEILGLTWGAIDFKAGLIDVYQQLQRPRTGVPATIQPTKTSNERKIALLPALASLLAKRRLAATFSADDDFVFAGGPGEPIHYSRANRLLKQAVELAGIAHVRSHDLRHTYASHLVVDLRLDVIQVQRQLGHARPSITTDIYTGLIDPARHAEELRQAMAASAFGALLGDRPAATPTASPSVLPNSPDEREASN